VTAQPVRPGEISDLIAWAARLSRTGPGSTSPAGTAAYLAAKANLLERITTASREQDGWARRDIDTARQAAAAARQAAITAPQEQS